MHLQKRFDTTTKEVTLSLHGLRQHVMIPVHCVVGFPSYVKLVEVEPERQVDRGQLTEYV